MKIKHYKRLFNDETITGFIKYRFIPEGYTVAVAITGGSVEVSNFRLKSNGDAYIYVTPDEGKTLNDVTAANVTLVIPHINNIIHIKQPTANATVTITCADPR